MRMLWKSLKVMPENVFIVRISSHTHELGGAFLPEPSSAKLRMTSFPGSSAKKGHEKSQSPAGPWPGSDKECRKATDPKGYHLGHPAVPCPCASACHAPSLPPWPPSRSAFSWPSGRPPRLLGPSSAGLCLPPSSPRHL